jgi:hypothetical protein
LQRATAPGQSRDAAAAPRTREKLWRDG